MSPELDKRLVNDFPSLYRDRHADMMSTAMCWGFETGDGWYNLIRELSEKLTFLAKAQNCDVRATQVKEKYGTLRFYVAGSTDIMQDCIEAADNKSGHTCENCGSTWGRVRAKGGLPHGWLACRCGACAYKEGYPLSDYEASELKVTDHVKEPSEE